jgi:hypothetical protein
MQILPSLKDVFGSISGLYTIGILGMLILVTLRYPILWGLNTACPPFLRLWKAPVFIDIRRRAHGCVLRYILYKNTFRRGSSWDSHTRAHVVFIVLHLTLNIVCAFVSASSSEEVFSRAGKLAVANAVLLYLGPCLDFSASILCIRLRTQRQLHASAGYVVATLSTIHAAGAFYKQGWLAIEGFHDLLAAIVLGHPVSYHAHTS